MHILLMTKIQLYSLYKCPFLSLSLSFLILLFHLFILRFLYSASYNPLGPPLSYTLRAHPYRVTAFHAIILLTLYRSRNFYSITSLPAVIFYSIPPGRNLLSESPLRVSSSSLSFDPLQVSSSSLSLDTLRVFSTSLSLDPCSLVPSSPLHTTYISLFPPNLMTIRRRFVD